MRITVSRGKKFSACRIQIGLMTYNLDCASNRARFIWDSLKQQGGYLHGDQPVFMVYAKEKGLFPSGISEGSKISAQQKERDDDHFRISRRDIALMKVIPLLENSRKEWVLPISKFHRKSGGNISHVRLLTDHVEEARRRALLLLRTLNIIAQQQDETCFYSVNSTFSCCFKSSNSAPGSIRIYDYP